jgi:hypothetical protein
MIKKNCFTFRATQARAYCVKFRDSITRKVYEWRTVALSAESAAAQAMQRFGLAEIISVD